MRNHNETKTDGIKASSLMKVKQWYFGLIQQAQLTDLALIAGSVVQKISDKLN